MGKKAKVKVKAKLSPPKNIKPVKPAKKPSSGLLTKRIIVVVNEKKSK